MCEARRAEYVRLLDEEGMNFTQAAHAVGVSKRTGKAWRNGRTRATGRNEKPLVDALQAAPGKVGDDARELLIFNLQTVIVGDTDPVTGVVRYRITSQGIIQHEKTR